MKSRFHLPKRGAFAFLAIAMLAALTTSLPTANAEPGKGQAKVAICHVDDDGEIDLLMVAEPGARALLRQGDTQPGGPVPGLDGLVYDDQCQPVFAYAQTALDVVNGVRFGIDPPCDPDAPSSPCGPENGGLLAPVAWDQGFAEMALPLAAACPVFNVSPEMVPDGVAVNTYLHWSPDPVTDAELTQLAIENWAEKQIQYNVLTGGGIRAGDTSTLSFKRLLSATRVGMGVRADCPNNRGVAVMILDPAPADGPVYPAICSGTPADWGPRPCVIADDE